MFIYLVMISDSLFRSTTMVDENGFPEDDDALSQFVPEDDPQSPEDLFGNLQGQGLDKDLSLSDTTSSLDDEDEEGDQPGDQDELFSPA